MSNVDIAKNDGADWRAAIAEGVEHGSRFGTLYATSSGLRCVLIGPNGDPTIVMGKSGSGTLCVPSIVDLLPASAWSEREAHDSHGVTFAGHEPMRPLLNHAPEWIVPVEGADQHEVAVGPIHAGIIESAHFRLHTVGERIFLLDLRLFYKHRGLEKAAEGKTLDEGLAYAQRACAGCAVSNSLAYAIAAESLMGYEANTALRMSRTVLLELERLWNHLNDLAAICAGVGFAAGNMAFSSLKEQAQRLNASLVGHRFLFGSVKLCGEGTPITPDDAREAEVQLHDIQKSANFTWGAFERNGSVQDRLGDIGMVTRHTALRLGAVGPTARASGVCLDARTHSTGLMYEGFEPAVALHGRGDVLSRTDVRFRELQATIAMLHRFFSMIANGGPQPGVERASKAKRGAVGVGIVESPRGETICCVEESRGKLSRLHLRTSSFANWSVVGEAVVGNVMGDFPLINKSFELCYACVDR